jgi:hypothetical protein
MKVFGRGYGEKMATMAEVVSNFDKLTEDIGVPVVMGVGFDLGFLYRWNTGLSAGITFDDIFTRGGEIARIGGGEAADGYYVPFSLNLGVAYDFKIGNFWQNAPHFIANTGVTAAFDWHNFDILFESENPYLKRNPILGIGVGLQLSFIDKIKVRVGLNEMLPAIGLGFDLGVFEMDFAYYGKELGLQPGQIPTAAFDLTFAIRPDAKAKQWPWTKTSLVGLLTHQNKESEEPSVATPEQPAETTKPEPMTKEPEPVEKEPEVVTKEPEPVVKEPEPVVKEPEPVAEEPEPVVKEPEPVAEEPEPVFEESEAGAEERETVFEVPEVVTEEWGAVWEEPGAATRRAAMPERWFPPLKADRSLTETPPPENGWTALRDGYFPTP